MLPLPGWLGRALAWLVATLGAVVAIFGVMRHQRGRGRDEGRAEIRDRGRDEAAEIRRRMDAADVPTSRNDAADRLDDGRF